MHHYPRSLTTNSLPIHSSRIKSVLSVTLSHKGNPDMNDPDKDKSQRQIELLQVLAEGCRKHPAYRARRAATEKCQECVVVWKARCDLSELSATHQ